MKRRILITAFMALAAMGSLKAQSHDNYVKTLTPHTAQTSKSALTKSNSVISWQYYDGLGRPWQTVTQGVNPNGYDLATLQEYDAYGRESTVWLPVVTSQTSGASVAKGSIATLSSSTYGDSKAYALPVYEQSPLDRISEQYGAGADWHNNSKGIKTEYLTNTASGELACRWYRTTDNRSTVSLSLVSGSLHYPAGTLQVTKSTDEDGHVSMEFKDKRGQSLLVRRMDGIDTFDTYYIYDSYGNLRAVLPPVAADTLTAEGTFTESTAALADYAYLYKYDTKNRVEYKKLPGCGWIQYSIDRADRVIATIDPIQAEKSTVECTFTLYDDMNRLVVKGTTDYYGSICYLNSSLCITGLDYGTDGYVNASGLENSGYTPGVTLYNPVVHTVNYYDNYKFRNLDGFNCTYFPANTNPAYGLLTGTVATLQDGSGKKLYTVYYYDAKGRLEKTVASNHLEGCDSTVTTYTFTGKPSTVTRIHTAGGKPKQTEVYTYTYDNADRVTKVTHKLNNGGTVPLANNTYDKLGRLQKNARNGLANLATNYTYNVRDWMTGNLYTQTLTYSYGGNIDTQQWTQDSKTRKYTYTYDGLNRLTAANYTGDGNYATSYAYDRNGNITALQRYDVSLVDNLTLDYNGNQLAKVEDASGNTFGFADGTSEATEYYYDANGNLTKDLNKNITNITYNSLYLPHVVTFGDGSTITYTYAADGRKLRTVHVIDGDTTTTDYCGNVIYENGTAKLLLIEGGYVDLTDNSYHFYIKDHLGNNRIVADANGNVEESNQYYPFGLSYANANSNLQPYKYNGKELDTKAGLNWYDYGARHYDAALGRWHVVDPLTEKFYSSSPFVYCGNNPINRIDPTGMEWEDDEEAERLKRRVEKKMQSLERENAKKRAKLNKGGLNTQKVNRLKAQIAENQERISHLQTSIDDINMLGNDKSNVYAFSQTDGGEHHVKKAKDGRVLIETSSDALSLHEISHVRQSLTNVGKLQFNPKGFLYNAGRTSHKMFSEMEIEAYKIQYSYDLSYPGTLSQKGIQGIDAKSIGNIYNPITGKYVYPIIRNYSLTLE